ncbi:UBP-type zinc finger domain-containing protein [Haladaptatus sp. YSMS36]|uniref:DUF7563 family protein n=1 Tax=unclassified Haladaptatus TaxID=2622732 RepID=UPI0034E93B1B
MKQCSNCGGFVTPDFVRVFGINNNEVWACLNCTTITDLEKYAGTMYGHAEHSSGVRWTNTTS